MPEGQMTLAALVHLKARPGRSSHARTSLLPSARGSDTSPRKSPGMPPAIAAHHRLFHLVARRLPAAVFLALVLASRACREFRVWAGMIGAKEPRHAETQRAPDP